MLCLSVSLMCLCLCHISVCAQGHVLDHTLMLVAVICMHIFVAFSPHMNLSVG